MRSTAIWAAPSVKEATAIAAIRAYTFSPRPSHSEIRIYNVWLAPFHLAHVAILDELEQRVTNGGDAHRLIEEYWPPVAEWYRLMLNCVGHRGIPSVRESDFSVL